MSAILIGFFEVFKKQKLKKTELVFIILGWVALLAHTANMLLRWYIAGHAPWSDAYESIVFIAWGAFAFDKLAYIDAQKIYLDEFLVQS